MLKVEIDGKPCKISFEHFPYREFWLDCKPIPAKTFCIIEDENSELVSEGHATCSFKDNFNRNTGRKIALMRALQNCLPKEKRKPVWDAYFALRHGKY
jgi:hypothetical protein